MRTEFLGVHVTPSVKTALKLEAEHKNLSVSALVADTLFNMLKQNGYTVEKDK